MEAPGGGVDVESLAAGGEKEKQDALAAGEKVKLGSLVSLSKQLELGMDDSVRRSRAQKRLRKRYVKHQRHSSWRSLPTISESEEHADHRYASQGLGSVPADRGSFFGEATVSLPRSLATFSMATFLATPAVRKEADEAESTDEKSSGESGEEDGGILAASIMEILSDLDESSEDQDGSQGKAEIGRRVTDSHRQDLKLPLSVAPTAETGIQEATSPVGREESASAKSEPQTRMKKPADRRSPPSSPCRNPANSLPLEDRGDRLNEARAEGNSLAMAGAKGVRPLPASAPATPSPPQVKPTGAIKNSSLADRLRKLASGPPHEDRSLREPTPPRVTPPKSWRDSTSTQQPRAGTRIRESMPNPPSPRKGGEDALHQREERRSGSSEGKHSEEGRRNRRRRETSGGRAKRGEGQDPSWAHPLDSAQDQDVQSWRNEVHQGKEKPERYRAALPSYQEGDDRIETLAPQTPPRPCCTDNADKIEAWEGAARADESGARVLQGSERRSQVKETTAGSWQAEGLRPRGWQGRNALKTEPTPDSILDFVEEEKQPRSFEMDTAQEDLTFGITEYIARKGTKSPEVYPLDALRSDPGGYHTEATLARLKEDSSSQDIFMSTCHDLNTGYTRPRELEVRSPRGPVPRKELCVPQALQTSGAWAPDPTSRSPRQPHTQHRTRLEGLGSCIFPNGDMYEGQFKDGLPHGYGYLKRPGGDAYAGTFKNGERSGSGVCHFEHGDSFEGTFAGDLPCGRGTFTSAGGEVFQGELQQGQVHGWGVRYFTNGTKAAGKWERCHLQWSRIISNQARLLALPALDIRGVELALQSAGAARRETSVAAVARKRAEQAVRGLHCMRSSRPEGRPQGLPEGVMV